ncbi:PAS domain S-box protein [Aquabacterium sp. A7-Y]|uniref:PAS domain S-box protein n=1 Tax=Aquabacterium sp. A7-Y TaxID=1349605 RepID=UPI00223E6265|nr:PAS domain S-box protein [Aquabacterium sp. A7-Y]MCW7539786.1 PAS domain S-box protein [Aquabacterium sp. A7-Y]
MAAPHPPLPPGLDVDRVYRSLFAAYPDALLLVDSSGTIMLANPAAATLLGYQPEELSGLPVDALVPDSIRPRHAAYREAYGRSPHARPMGTQMELVAKRRDGREVMVEIALSPLQDQGLPYVVAAIRGIEAYPRVRQALQRARYSEHVAQFGRLSVHERDPQLLLEQAPVVAAEALQVETAVVFLLDPGQQSFRVAAGVGLLEGEGLGERLPNRPDSLPGYVLAQDRPVRVGDCASEQRFELPRRILEAGQASLLAAPLSDRGRDIGALVVRSRERDRFGDDELRFMESLASLLVTALQRAHSEEALSHSQRLDSVGQLTGGIAHDFNNLLTVISGNLQVLEELPALADDAYGQQLVAAATRATRRGAELTGQLLAFSRRQVLQPAPVDVPALLHSLAGLLGRTLDQRIRIEVQAPQDGLSCLADPGQLESALLNIAINARDAMPEGGTLSFACEPIDTLPVPLQEDRGEATPAASVADGYIAIAVADTGAGMPDAVKERAFEPFFTTKEAGRGTGLGLSTVYGFVKQSRGAVSLDSAPGAGTTVTLYLPSVQAAAGDQDAAADDSEVPPGLHVLLVEDDAEVRAVVRRFLETLGCRVTACLQAEEALALLSPQAGYELLLSDIALGAGMRGTELARRAQAIMPELPVLLMTGFSSGLLDAPPEWELLRKPYTRGDLARAIVKVLGPG